ncbi:MAG: hypothetical protein KJ623_04210 [Nanoarchaeota archaeon]|nr:hypothetical protein [Nanoarchaeota archaeon]
MKQKTIIWALVILLLIANFFDLITTVVGVNLGIPEKNFFARYLISVNTWVYVFVKIGLISYVALPFKYCFVGLLVNKFSKFKKYIYAAYIVGLSAGIVLFSIAGFHNLGVFWG